MASTTRESGFQFGDLDSALAIEEELREVPVVEDVRAEKHAADCREREVKRPVPFPASGGGDGVNPIPIFWWGSYHRVAMVKVIEDEEDRVGGRVIRRKIIRTDDAQYPSGTRWGTGRRRSG